MGITRNKRGKVRRTRHTTRRIPKKFDYKLMSLQELEKLFQDVSPILFKYTKPMHHQYASVAFAAENTRVLFPHGIGTGKTLAGIWTSWMWEPKRTLVIGPYEAFDAWVRDLTKYTDFTFITLEGTASDRKRLMEEEYDYYIINYEGLKVLFGQQEEGGPSEGKKEDIGKEGKIVGKVYEEYNGKRGIIKSFHDEDSLIVSLPNEEEVIITIKDFHLLKKWKINHKSLTDRFDCLIFDEIHRASTIDSLQSKLAYELSWRAKKVVGLTGSLCGKKNVDENLLQLWYTMRVIDLGKSLGGNFYQYRNAYFRKSYYSWKLKKKSMEEKILRRIASSCIRYEKSECIDLPPEVRQVKSILMTKEQIQLENKIIADMVVNIQNHEINIGNASAKSHKLKQLASGFIYTSPGEDKEPIRVKSNKLKELGYIMEEIEKKVIIFFHYVEEGVILEEWLKKKKILYTTIIGSDTKKERSENFKKFTQNKKVQVLLGQDSCASESWELIVASTIIFFNQTTSGKIREQDEGRIIRAKKKGTCLIIDLITKGSVEELAPKQRENESKAAKIVLDYIKQKGGVVD